MTADFSVRITVRNGRLLRAIRERYGSSAEMARQCHISPSTIAALLTMKLSPVLKTGDWSRAAYDISSALQREPEELWPAHVARLKLERNEAEIDMSMDDVQDMLRPGQFGAAMKAVEKWSRHVSPRKMRALVMMAEGASFDEMGKEFGVSRERARQLALNAARRIRTVAARDGVKGVEDLRL